MRRKIKPGLLWITGLSGSGKTTISKIVVKKLKKKYSNIIHIDGDKIRRKLNIKNKKSFTNSFRTEIGLKYVKICKQTIKKNKYVVISTMALIKSVQTEYKKIRNSKDVFLDVPLKELIKRDPKGLYKSFFQKKIKNMVGLDIHYDKPLKPTLIIKWNKNLTAFKISKKILKLFNN